MQAFDNQAIAKPRASPLTRLLVGAMATLVLAVGCNGAGLAMPCWMKLTHTYKSLHVVMHITAGLWKMCMFMTPSSPDVGTKCMPVEDFYTKVEVLLNIVRVTEITATGFGLVTLALCIAATFTRARPPFSAMVLICVSLVSVFVSAILTAVGLILFGIKQRKTKHSMLYVSYYLCLASGLAFVSSAVVLILSLVKLRKQTLATPPYAVLN